jgi:tetratricopeptide (TPR) repeat protein
MDHINTADTINNLGSTYDSQGKYDEAIAQYERALKIFEGAFGNTDTVLEFSLIRFIFQMKDTTLTESWSMNKLEATHLTTLTLIKLTVVQTQAINRTRTKRPLVFNAAQKFVKLFNLGEMFHARARVTSASSVCFPRNVLLTTLQKIILS